jgi:hypothetical protein
MQVQELIHQAGPLPLKGGFISGAKGSVLIAVTGTLVSQSQDILMQLDIYLDGKRIGSAELWSNAPNTHRALPTAFIGLPSLSPGQHTIMLAVPQGNSAGADINDRFSASLIY